MHVVDEVLVGSVRGLGPVVVGWIATRRHPVPRRVVDSHSAEVHSIPLLIKSLRDLDLTVPAQKGRIWVPGVGEGRGSGKMRGGAQPRTKEYFAQKRSKAYPFHLAIIAVKRIPEFTRRNIGQFLRLSKSMFMSE